MKKDIEWLKNEMRIRGRFPAENEYVVEQYRQIMELINQLDEPEKPVIPQFVADWIDAHDLHGNNPLREYRDLENDFNEGWTDEKDAAVYHWVNKNPYAFIDALRYGYEVEKEKLYYLRLRDEDLPLYKAYDMKRWKYKLVYSAHHLRNENFLTVTFSESEIENMDIRSFELEEVAE